MQSSRRTASLDLALEIDSDGSAQVQGEISLGGDTPRVLVAPSPGVSATCRCADADGNRRAGLVHMATQMQDTRTAEWVSVDLATLVKHDIDRSGVYVLTAQVGEERTTLEVRIAIVSRPETR